MAYDHRLNFSRRILKSTQSLLEIRQCYEAVILTEFLDVIFPSQKKEFLDFVQIRFLYLKRPTLIQNAKTNNIFEF